MKQTALASAQQFDASQQLIQKISDKQALVSIVGLGYVGLPLAVQVAKAGYSVWGVENNPRRCEDVNQGRNYIQDIQGADDLFFRRMVKEKRIKASSDFSPLREADIVLICVPTPLNKNKEPDISYIEHVVDGLRKNSRPGQLIVLESTTYPGTTEEVILPAIEKLGYKVGRDFFLAFSPERIDPGNKTYHTGNTTKVVGGVTPTCSELAEMFYGKVIERMVRVSSPRVAEMTKIFENVYRSVNIALVNELAMLCDRMSIDVFEVIQAAATKPYGFQPFWPGPGVGGHCIPLDPYYLAWKGREYDVHARFIELAGEINENMPRFVVSKVSEILNRDRKPIHGSKILQLGIAYKKDTDDYRESPAERVYSLLNAEGANIEVADPLVSEFFTMEHSPVYDKQGSAIKTVELTPARIAAADLVVLVTDHSKLNYSMIFEHARLIFDTRNAFATRGMVAEKVIKLSTHIPPVKKNG